MEKYEDGIYHLDIGEVEINRIKGSKSAAKSTPFTFAVNNEENIKGIEKVIGCKLDTKQDPGPEHRFNLSKMDVPPREHFSISVVKHVRLIGTYPLCLAQTGQNPLAIVF